MIDAKTLATALWCVNLIDRHKAQFTDRPTDEELHSAWMRIEWALRSAHIQVNNAGVAADRSQGTMHGELTVDDDRVRSGSC